MGQKEPEKKPNLLRRISNSLLVQIAILFLIGILVIGIGTFMSQSIRSDGSVKERIENYASQIAKEVRLALKEYSSYKWLLRYWYEHADDMHIEYDVGYNPNSITAEKCQILADHYPGVVLRYVTMAQIQEMTPEDQRLYAEVAYTWLTYRIDEIKRSYDMDYLFIVRTTPPYDTQFFLFSGAEANQKRGTEYEQVYTLGVVSTVGESQQEAMEMATHAESHLADAGNYVDYYSLIEMIGNEAILTGMTYDASDMIAKIRENTWYDTSYAIAYQLLMYLVFMLLTYLFILKPLKQVQQNIRMYTNTKDSEAIRRNLAKIRPHNEIGELSADVSGLAREIEEYTGQLEVITAERERIGVELALATGIQESMLPSEFPAFPDRTEFDLYASMDPAKEVGGDFYDFYLVDDDHLALTMADVSGKGIPAALFMMASKIILANNVMMGKSPAEALRDTNEAICANNKEEMFVTIWLGILEISTGRLTAANAGHEYPVLMNGTDGYELFKDKHGFVVGGMAGMKYKDYEIELQPGAKLFLYTDGLPEANDPQNRLFGTDRVLEALNTLTTSAPEGVLQGVRKAVDGFVEGAEQFDDLTMLCLEYRGGKNNG